MMAKLWERCLRYLTRYLTRKTYEVAQTAGVCWGVDRAIKGVMNLATAAEGAKRPKPVVLGQLVHNERAVQRLEAMGVAVIDHPQEAKRSLVVITAHGRDPKDIARMKQEGLGVLDMTCPIVQDQHAAAQRLQREDRRMILIGTRKPHVEVEGTKGVLNNQVDVVESREDVARLPYGSGERMGVVAQTTYDPKVVSKILEALRGRFKDVQYLPTTCNDITLKLEELRGRGKRADTVIVVSDRDSANGDHLAETAREMGKRVVFILDRSKLTRETLRHSRRIFVTAAASTMDPDIHGVTRQLESWDWKRRKPKGPVITKEERAQMTARQLSYS